MIKMKETAGCLMVGLLVCSFTPEQDPLQKSNKVATLKTVGEDEVTVCDFSSIKSDVKEIPLSLLTEELQIVKLDDRDEALVGSAGVTITDNYILIGKHKQNPYKLFDIKGNYIGTVGAIGQGPGEYTNIYDQQIDEIGGRIYLLPWQSGKLLAYDLKGKYLAEDLSMGLSLPKAKFRVNPADTSVSVTTLAIENAPLAYTIKPFKNNEIAGFIRSGHLALPPQNIFNNEVNSARNTDAYDFSYFMFFNRRPDTLYHYDVKKNLLRPQFTVNFGGEVPIHSYKELPNHYMGDVAIEKKETENTSTTTDQRFYIIDKKTMKGAYFKLINDYLGGIEIGWPIYSFNDGYYVASMEPSELQEALEKALSSNKKMDKKIREKLTKLKESITENDNNYILFAKLKK